MVAMTVEPLFSRIWLPAGKVFDEQIATAPILSVFADATFDHLRVLFDLTPTSTTTDFDFHFDPALTEIKLPRSTVVVMETIAVFASATWAKTARPKPSTNIPWTNRVTRD